MSKGMCENQRGELLSYQHCGYWVNLICVQSQTKRRHKLYPSTASRNCIFLCVERAQNNVILNPRPDVLHGATKMAG